MAILVLEDQPNPLNRRLSYLLGPKLVCLLQLNLLELLKCTGEKEERFICFNVLKKLYLKSYNSNKLFWKLT